MCFVLVDDFLRVALKFSDLHRLTLDVSLQRLYQFPFCLLFLLGHKVREAKQHAGKWLWQYIQWLWDGWFGVRASPRIMVCANWQREKSNKTVCLYTVRGDFGSRHDSWTSLCSLSRRGRLRSSGWLGEGSSIPELDDLEMEPDPTLPSTEDVIRKTEQITKNIQELLRAAQENKHDRSESTFRICFLSFHFLGSILNLQFLFFHHNSVIISCLYLLSFPLLLVIFTLPLHSTSTSIVSVSRCPRPSPVWADHVSVKACVGSGTAWDVSALWCPGLRRPPLPFSRSASGPLTPPPGTLASVPASQAQFYFPLPHLCPSVSPANNLALLVWCAAECVQFKKTVSELMSCIYALTWFWHVGECSWCNTCIQADVNAV